MAEEEYLSIEDVAKLLGVDYKTIYKRVRAGDLPAAKIGRVYRIRRTDLDEFFERSKNFTKGIECSLCGRILHSRLSIGAQCEECGAPLCSNCAGVKKSRRCKEHQESEKPSNAG